MKFLIVAFALVAVAFAAEKAPIGILRQESDVQPDGTYAWKYETENGISANEEGKASVPSEEGQAVAAQGQFSYTAPDGTPIQVSYVANENGFQPQGAHIPVAPPVPEAIQRSIEYNLAHPEENQK